MQDKIVVVVSFHAAPCLASTGTMIADFRIRRDVETLPSILLCDQEPIRSSSIRITLRRHISNSNTATTEIMEGDYDTDIPNIDDYHTELVEFLVDNPTMKHAARSAMKQGLGAAAGATVGGLILGPVGGLVGGIVGSIAGFLAVDDYDGIVQQVIKIQSEAQKERLIKGVRQVLMTAGASMPTSAAGFRSSLIELAGQRHVREQVWKLCMDAVDT
jgi:hypothetical protein